MKPEDIVTVLADHGCTNLKTTINEQDCLEHPVASGGLGDVFYGKLLDGRPIAIKTVRANYDRGQLARVYHKRAAKEIYTWSKCKHPNVVRLLGLSVFHGSLAMVSRWQDNGNLLGYLEKHSDADRCKLSTLICAGLAYLHKNDIVHGDLKGANILISQIGTPMIMDFGNANLRNATLQFTATNTGPGYSLRWVAPEMLAGATTHTAAGDIYSLGMTILEAFTSQVPYADKAEYSLLMHIMMHKKMPERPERIIPKKSINGDTLWDILTKCWSHDPAERPTAEFVWNTLKPITPEGLKEIEDGNEESEE